MVKSFTSPAEFLSCCQPFLEEKELENNMMLGSALNLLKQGIVANRPAFFVVEENGVPVLCAMRRTDNFLLAAHTYEKESMEALVAELRRAEINIPLVFAEPFLAFGFQKLWNESYQADKKMLVHELRSVLSPAVPDGQMIHARESDRSMLVEWAGLFFKEVGLHVADDHLPLIIDRSMGNHDLFVWLYEDKVVSMTATARRTPRIGIVGLVYTPPEERGKGYATALVKTQSEMLLNQGLLACGLFTDQDNPASNKAYAKIGYVPGKEFVEIVFEGGY